MTTSSDESKYLRYHEIYPRNDWQELIEEETILPEIDGDSYWGTASVNFKVPTREDAPEEATHVWFYPD